ncbi:MAG: sulfotransferase [Nevskiaceae bacterium]|nr:MAG: sulfotransferase [Nevskiaceae bacterium]
MGAQAVFAPATDHQCRASRLMRAGRSWLSPTVQGRPGTLMRSSLANSPEGSPGRVFLVGCPRSGTTFLQDLLARHPQVMSLPETAFFDDTVGGFSGWVRSGETPKLRGRFGYAGRAARRNAPRKLHEIAEATGLTAPRLCWRWRYAAYVRQFTELLDAAALSRGRSLWLEKTPNHLAYLPYIEALVPGARCIHLVRRGEDVIASLVDAGLRYEQAMDAFDHCLAWWAGQWNRSVEVHRRYAGAPRHLVLFYEDLIADLSGQFRRICEFLGIAVLQPGGETPEIGVARLSREPWKQTAVSGRLVVPEDKRDSALSAHTRRWLRANLYSYQQLREQVAAAQAPRASGGLVPGAEEAELDGGALPESRLRPT